MRVENDMNISGLNALLQNQNTAQATQNATKSVFDDVLNAAVSMFDETNEYQKQAEVAQLQFITGRNDDMLSVMLAQEKAMSALNFTVQVTNKVVEAYKEIMRIQI